MNGWRAPPHAGDDLSAELTSFRDAVARELHAQLALRGERLDLVDLPGVAHAVAVQLGREFRIECDSSRLGAPDDESLGLDSAVFYGSALQKREGQEPSDRYPIFDYEWPTRMQ